MLDYIALDQILQDYSYTHEELIMMGCFASVSCNLIRCRSILRCLFVAIWYRFKAHTNISPKEHAKLENVYNLEAFFHQPCIPVKLLRESALLQWYNKT